MKSWEVMYGTVGIGDIFGSPYTRTGFEEVIKDFHRGGLGFSTRPGRVEFKTHRPGEEV